MPLLPSRISLYRLGYSGLVLLTLALCTIPGITTSGVILWPDLVYCITIAWLIRAPMHVPPWLLVGVFLLRDILLGLPPGLWTAMILLTGLIIILSYEWLRSHIYLIQWILVAGLYLCALIAMQSVLLITRLPVPTSENLVRSFVMTALAYPLASALIALIIREDAARDGTTEGATGWL